MRGTGRDIRPGIAVLEIIEAIKRPRAAPHVPVQTFVRVELAVGLREMGIHSIEGKNKWLRRSQVLLGALRLGKREDFALDNRAPRVAAKLLPLKRRSLRRQRGRTLIP